MDTSNNNSITKSNMSEHLMLPSIRGSSYEREPLIPVAMAPAISKSTDLLVDQDGDDLAEVGKSKKQRLSVSSKKSKKKARSTDNMDLDMVSTSSAPTNPSSVTTTTTTTTNSNDVNDEDMTLSINDEDVTFLRSGVKENITVIACAPVNGLFLGIGTSDGWLQYWSRDSAKRSPTGKSVSLVREFDFSNFEAITTINWRSDSRFLVVANVKGQVRVISSEHLEDGSGGGGEFVDILLPSHHQGPVFAAKWSPSGSYLLTAGLDQSVAIWDMTGPHSSYSTTAPRRLFRHHKGAVMDVDWRTDQSFASCSVDRTIIVYNNWLEQSEPVQIFTGHTDEVNSIAWDPTRTILASCSDDFTARLWKTSQPTAIHTLSDHKKEIYSIAWSPVESRSGSHWLATASLDTTVRLWDPETGKCVRTLAKHGDAAFSASFSPDGEYLATGARDSAVHIWSLREGMVVRSLHAGPGGVTGLSWTRDGKSLVASSNNDICVFDMPSQRPNS
jgi:transducin (beta)-like 1